MFRFLKFQSQPWRSQTPPRRLRQHEVDFNQHQSSAGNKETVEGELTAKHHLPKAQSLNNVSKAERGKKTHRGGYTSESKERRIRRAGRHGCTKIVWVAVGWVCSPQPAVTREAWITELGHHPGISLSSLGNNFILYAVVCAT